MGRGLCYLEIQAQACVQQPLFVPFRFMLGSHTGSRIADALESAVEQFGIQDKIRSIITDNAANMKVCFPGVRGQ